MHGKKKNLLIFDEGEKKRKGERKKKKFTFFSYGLLQFLLLFSFFFALKINLKIIKL